MEHNGWIKLHRKLLEKGYWNKSQYVHLWVHLLVSANHKPKEYMTNGKIILIKEGQLLTGRKQLSLATGIPQSTIEDILKVFENEQQIRQQKTTKYRLITIVNWQEHQNPDIKPTSSRHQADTNKNDKKEKNIAVADAPAPIEIVSDDTDKPQRAEKKPTYPNARKIFPLFPDKDESWNINTTELRAGEILAKKGEDDVKKAIGYCTRHLNDDGFPIKSLTPYLLATNWKRIYDYARRNG